MKRQAVNTVYKNPHKLTKEQLEFAQDLKHSIKQVEQHLNGKIQLQSAKQFLKEF